MKQLDDVWFDRDLPVLREVARRIDGGEPTPTVTSVAESLSMEVDVVQLAAKALERRGYVGTLGTAGRAVLRFKDLSGSAYLVTGLHPSGDDFRERLVSILEGLAERADNEDDASALRKTATQFGVLSRDALAGLAASMATAGILG
ncbi:hypothetical protein [Ornithinimicrobium tianjinense]|uniref:Uncharacterized protein n=1 Tax=Ornithinimicrobium tianjinense TaxID=1195761 RepID=A0A917BPD7_9MICO|nr:hypothetical protein [Ornithinimicrobium tianjinense]GGF49113.1 hypothetical protein GCM10011366_16250 [Ornithinimicrobium tianjinense]